MLGDLESEELNEAEQKLAEKLRLDDLQQAIIEYLLLYNIGSKN